jgi:hypothetical protein
VVAITKSADRAVLLFTRLNTWNRVISPLAFLRYFVTIQVYFLLPPPGLGMRPFNDAGASTSGQTGRKEAAGRKGSGDTPPRGLAGPLEPPAESLRYF